MFDTVDLFDIIKYFVYQFGVNEMFVSYVVDVVGFDAVLDLVEVLQYMFFFFNKHMFYKHTEAHFGVKNIYRVIPQINNNNFF